MMTTTKSWHISPSDPCCILGDRNGYTSIIANVTMGSKERDHACLIAAAPDLLAALTAIVEFEASPDFSLWAKRIDAARAAIAKAIGTDNG